MVRRMSDALQVKGFAWLNLLNYVREKWGDTLDELARAFPAHHLGALEWLVHLRHDGKGLAERNLSGTFRSLTRLEDLKLATERAYGRFYSQGKMKLALSGELTGFPAPTPIFGNAGMVAFLRAGHVEAVLNKVTVGPSSISYQVQVSKVGA